MSTSPTEPLAAPNDILATPVEERPAWHIPGGLGLLGVIVLLIIGVLLVVVGAGSQGGGQVAGITFGIIIFFIGLLAFSTIKINAPGQTRVLQFFGTYIGTIRKPGLWLTRPFSGGTLVSVKVRNFETNELKVNDADGNPVNIAAIIVWQVEDTAKAVYAVEDFEQFVAVQSESALRHIASTHPYDSTNPDVESLRGSTEQIAQELADEVGTRIALAGLRVVEARISSLAYAPEIAQAMLQRQQAAAIIAAREKIVEGAVTMVQGALTRLEQDHIVELDDERKATMVANLLVVLCGDQRATPVINTGSLYGN
ncbi:MAG: SPFH domain-containing protein [Propionibacteriaceae bacterium]|nr:SPFH domain-containing protein [Propionibacteriaceae bacterium]